jgi:Integrase zinc binding domain
VVLFLLKMMVKDILQEVHHHKLAHPGGLLQTQEQVLKDYYWPSMDTNIATHLKACLQCHPSKPQPSLLLDLNSKLTLVNEPNQRTHLDIPSPFWTTKTGERNVLTRGLQTTTSQDARPPSLTILCRQPLQPDHVQTCCQTN